MFPVIFLHFKGDRDAVYRFNSLYRGKIMHLFLKKGMLCKHNSFILLCSIWGICWLCNCGTKIGSAFFWSCFWSSFLYVQNYCDRMLNSLSTSWVGFSLPVTWKVCSTEEIAFLTVPSARGSWRLRQNLPVCRAMANTLMMVIASAQLLGWSCSFRMSIPPRPSGQESDR